MGDISPYRRKRRASGCSSGVEHNLAKVGVEGSNPFARSKLLIYISQIRDKPDLDSGYFFLGEAPGKQLARIRSNRFERSQC